MRLTLAWRWAELRMLLPLAILVPLGFFVTHVAREGVLEAGSLTLAMGYLALMLAAHAILVLSGQRGDQLLLPLVATIGGVGLVMLNRLAPEVETTQAFGLQLDVAQTQLLWFSVGTVAMLVVAVGLRDDGPLRHYKYTWAALGIGMLVFTALFGFEVNGARLWVALGPIAVQPGEFVKIVLVIFIAGYLADNRALLTEASLRIGPIRVPPLPYLLPMLALFGVVMLVVVRQNDLGQALLLFGIFLTMLFVATGRRSYVLIGLLLFVAGVFVAYRLFPHVAVRVDIWIDPFADPTDRGFQPIRGLFAFARGGLFGEGLGQGLPSSIPLVHTDFIFAAIAEELGLIGAFAVLALFLTFVFRGLRIAMLARDEFSALLAVGITASLGLQTLIIVAGNLKLIPLTGITLPFVSYGGSSILASFLMIGLLLSVSHRTARAIDREQGLPDR
ncbi:MAG TPA: FtsW/RodA/SpoVE family cell cycle protein [Candidatus Limnocylindria bacterium]|nr:FtsW/RodA/SpoVE family cell cycle protein [Candidatus Limnocylindria bacterium]